MGKILKFPKVNVVIDDENLAKELKSFKEFDKMFDEMLDEMLSVLETNDFFISFKDEPKTTKSKSNKDTETP